ncbi:MAG: ABC transporter ATP-binding protein [Firmicutes bacterium]|nr:ABC transporter ATP-binding protein [Bacillota bacterium]
MYSIETKNLTKKFKEKTAVNGVNLHIKDGELFALLGVNGAGKTTTIKMLSAIMLPTDGSIAIEGMDMRKEPNKIKELLNISPQETAIAPNLTVRENLEFIAGVYQIRKPTIKINEIIRTFKLEELQKQKAKTLSGGWQRRLSIAMSLINDPKVLFLDEPTLGLDVIARKELWDIIGGLKGKMTTILTTHYMEEAEALSDRIGIMADGRLIAVGTAEELKDMAGTGSFEDAFVAIATGKAASAAAGAKAAVSGEPSEAAAPGEPPEVATPGEGGEQK